MNGRKMFRQKSAKQTNAQTQARQANKQTVKSAHPRCPNGKKQLSSNGNNAKDHVDLKTT